MRLAPRTRLPARRKSGGVAIITAIFLLVVLAGLGAAIVTMSTAQQSASAQDVLAQRAYQAARAGIEWSLYTALTSSSTPDVALGCTVSPSSSRNVALPAGTTLSSFTVTVSCTPGSAGIAGGDANDGTAHHFQIISVACNQPGVTGCPNASPGPEYVQRRITAQL